MADKPIIAITGATGAQGGSLARAILNDPDRRFGVRALTRDGASAKARELEALGAEIVAADLDDAASVRRAFAGAYGAFCLTFFWEHHSPEKELAQAKIMAEAASEAGLRHVIWSTEEDARDWVPLDDPRMPTLMGRYKVPHTDAKAEGNRFFTELGVPVTFLWTSMYWENFIHFGMGPQPTPDGHLAITMPMGNKKLPGIAVEDIGKCTLGILKRRDEFIGQTVGIAGDDLTVAQMAAAFAEALNRDIRYNEVTPEAFRSFGFPGAEDIGNMFQFKRDFNEDFCAARSLERTRALNPDLQNFKTWLAKNQDRIPLPE